MWIRVSERFVPLNSNQNPSRFDQEKHERQSEAALDLGNVSQFTYRKKYQGQKSVLLGF